MNEDLTFLECWKCKESLCIGQGSWLYLNEGRVRENLTLFLQRHADHALTFTHKTGHYGLDWSNFDNLPYEEKLRKPS